MPQTEVPFVLRAQIDAIAEACRIKLVDLDDTIYRFGRYLLIPNPTADDKRRYRELLAKWHYLIVSLHEFQEEARKRGYTDRLFQPYPPSHLRLQAPYQNMERYHA